MMQDSKHYTGRVSVTMIDRETGVAVVHKTYGVEYTSGNVEPDKNTIARKALNIAAATLREVRDERGS